MRAGSASAKHEEAVLLAETIVRCESLQAAGRLLDPCSQLELDLLRRELAMLLRVEPDPPRRAPGTHRFLWRRAQAARVEAGQLRSTSSRSRARSALLCQHATTLRAAGG
jgi:hypothetical protein